MVNFAVREIPRGGCAIRGQPTKGLFTRNFFPLANRKILTYCATMRVGKIKGSITGNPNHLGTSAFAWLLLASMIACSSKATSRVETLPFAIKPALPSASNASALTVYSNFSGQFPPLPSSTVRPHSKVTLSFGQCVRQARNYGEPVWSCSPIQEQIAPDELRFFKRLNTCVDIDRKVVSNEILRSLQADLWVPPSITGTHILVVRTKQINQSDTYIPLGCEGVQEGQTCDPVGAEYTGETVETRAYTRVLVVGEGAGSNPDLEADLFPGWNTSVSFLKLETSDEQLEPRNQISTDEARKWMSHFSKLDVAKLNTESKLALHWNLAVLAFKTGDIVRGAAELATVEARLTGSETVYTKIAAGAPVLHALIDGSVTLADPCTSAVQK
jgi:hypothetical protein